MKRAFYLLKRARLLPLALALLAQPGWAASVRVASWNFSSTPPSNSPTATAPPDLKAVASAFKKIDPDIILLQHVKDWKTCLALAQALKPADYHVAICSSFRSSSSNALAPDQAAILSREPAYFSWSENWRPRTNGTLPGGYAFAALSFGPYKIGVFSVQMDQDLAGDLTLTNNVQARRAGIKQLADQAAAIRRWTTNRVQCFNVGGTLKSLSFDLTEQNQTFRNLRDSGFEDAWLDAPANQKTTIKPAPGQRAGATDFFFASPVGTSMSAKVWRLPGASRFPLSCDLELDPEKVAAVGTVRRTIATEKALARSNQLFQARALSNSIPSAAPGPTASKSDQALALPPQKQAPAPPGAKTAESLARTNLADPRHFSGVVTNQAAVEEEVRGADTGRHDGWLFLAGGGAVLLLAAGWLLFGHKRPPGKGEMQLIPQSFDIDASDTAYVVVTPRSVTTSATDAPAEPATPFVHVENPAASLTHSESSIYRPAPGKPAEPITTGERRHLLQWLKKKFVRKLVSDRAALIQASHETADAVLHVDQRLNRIEQQIQEQNRRYERRIQELTIELAAAQEGNRELIRARIAQLRSEMEASRARLEQAGNNEMFGQT